MLSGAGLATPDVATTVRVQGAGRQVQDGPYCDAKEQLGGFFVIDVSDLDAALDWARRRPDGIGSAEVGPVLPTPWRSRPGRARGSRATPGPGS